MTAIEKLVESPLVQKILLKKLKQVFVEGNISLVTISLDEKGNLKFGSYDEEIVIMSKQDFENLTKNNENGNKNI